MRKPLKYALIAAAAIVIVVAAVLAVGYARLDDIVKKSVEVLGPRFAGVPVTVSEVNLSPLSGHGIISGIVVGNPDGFKSSSAIELGKVEVKLEPRSLLTDTIVINRIHVAAPHITYEIGMSGSNIGQIQKNLESGAPEEEKPAPDESEKPGKKVIIEDLLIEDAKISLSAALLGGKRASLPMPRVHLTDIGKETGGTSPAEALRIAFSELTNVIVRTVKASGKLIGSGAGAVKDAGSGLLEGIKGVFRKNEE